MKIDVNDRAAVMLGGQSAQDVANERFCRCFIIKIAVQPIRESVCTEFGEPGIKTFAYFAELCLGRVSQGKDRKVNAFKGGCGIRHNCLVECGCALRWLAFTPRGSDNEYGRRSDQRFRRCVGRIQHLDFESTFPGSRTGAFCESFGIAGFGQIKNRQGGRRRWR